MWSVVEKTALAEAEVEYEDYTSDMVWVKFPVARSAAETSKENREVASASVVIWTTTPWTIPGNRAISYSPKIEYGLYEVVDAPSDNWAKQGDRFVLADKLAIDVFRQARVTAFKRLRAVSADDLQVFFVSIHSRASTKATILKSRFLPATMSPKTRAPASSIPRQDTGVRTSMFGPPTRASLPRAASIQPFLIRSTPMAASPSRRPASPASAC